MTDEKKRMTDLLTCLQLEKILLWLEQQGKITVRQRQKALQICAGLCDIDPALL